MFVQSNGFAGHDAKPNATWRDGEAYSELTSRFEIVERLRSLVLAFWSRFVVKQTYDELRPKRTFTPHISNHTVDSGRWSTETAVHGPQSISHGWEWYEMGFLMSRNASGQLTLLCFDLPAKSQSAVESAFQTQALDVACPYAVFASISDELLRLYDNSVWSIRNHISRWEAVRQQPRYVSTALIKDRNAPTRPIMVYCTR